MGTRLLGLVLGLVMVGTGLVAGTAQRVSAGESCFGYDPTIYAQGGVTNGTGKRDVIYGSQGDDIINGLGGDDLICDSWGANVINGGSGNDDIEGSGELNGDSGDDEIYGTDGATSIDGGSGNDYITTEGNQDLVIHGGSGNDFIDILYAASVYGDAGNDSIIEGGQAGYLNCGSGRDRLSYDSILDGPYQCEGPLIL